MGKRGRWGAPSSIPPSQLWECLEPIPSLPKSLLPRLAIQTPQKFPNFPSSDPTIAQKTPLRGEIWDAQIWESTGFSMMENPWMRPPRPGFPCGCLTCAKNPRFAFQHSLGTKRGILGRILHPHGSALVQTEGGTQRCPRILLTPSPAIPFPAKQEYPGWEKTPLGVAPRSHDSEIPGIAEATRFSSFSSPPQAPLGTEEKL